MKLTAYGKAGSNGDCSFTPNGMGQHEEPAPETVHLLERWLTAPLSHSPARLQEPAWDGLGGAMLEPRGIQDTVSLAPLPKRRCDSQGLAAFYTVPDRRLSKPMLSALKTALKSCETHCLW